MATLRKGSCYKKITRAYTRKSKFKKKGFIKSVPNIKVVRFEMGDPKKEFTNRIVLKSKDAIQIRHNAIESARQVVNRVLHKKLGTSNYFFKISIYPHHILRENKALTGAHADRLQSGMSHAFGTPMGLAAQVKKGKDIFIVKVNKEHINVAIEAIKKATPRIPCRCSIETS